MLRPAEKKDIQEITLIYNYYIENSTALYHYNSKSFEEMEEWHSEKEKAGFPIIAAEIDGVVAGFATYGPYRPFEGFKKTIEHSVYLRKDYQGKGLGRTLLKEILQKAKEKEYHAALAYIDSENTTSIRLHEKEGFFRCGVIKEAGYKFDRYLDLVILEKLF